MRIVPYVRLSMRAALAAWLGAACLLPTAAAAQYGTVKSVHNDWQVRCETAPGAPGEQCALVQSVTAEDRPNVGLTVIILRTADQKNWILRVFAPLGVLLAKGIGLTVDQTYIGSAQFERCLQNGCISNVQLDEKLLAQMKAGKVARFDVYQTPEEGIGLPLSLSGFSAGFDRLDKGR
ncbi:MAG: invasion associated locus B family protein [Rhizobiales bacterium]|jgi:invasion protein IalB|nr:invasion associated locus B family protein [Hyphomicrobiales bacterium]